jgi:hypothetical protein
MLFYLILDKFLLYFHAGVTLFGALGWIFKKTRKLNLFVLVVTMFSWVVLGIWYGWGYCVLTDIHWNIKERMGDFNIPRSYIKYLVDEITGLNFDARLVDIVTVIWFCIALICSVLLNIYDFRKSKQTILNK